MATCLTLDDNDLETISSIYTMSALKRLLGKTYTVFIDELRRTYGQNQRADFNRNLWDIVAELEQDRKNNRKTYKKLARELTDITLTDEERADIEQDYYEAEQNIEELTEDLATIRGAKVETYSELKDLMQQFIVGYLAPLHYITPYELDTRAVALFGAEYVPNYEPQNKRDKALAELPTTPRHLKNRAEFEQFSRAEQVQILVYFVRIKRGQRAVNQYIREQANKGADYTKKITSLETFKTEKGEQYEKDIIPTANTYAESIEDLERIKGLLISKELTPKQSRFIRQFCTQDARTVEQKARSKYHAEQYDKARKNGDLKRFEQRLTNAGYMARRTWAFEQIGITKPNRQAEHMKAIAEKLEPYYRELISAEPTPSAEPKATPKTRQKNRRPQKAQTPPPPTPKKPTPHKLSGIDEQLPIIWTTPSAEQLAEYQERAKIQRKAEKHRAKELIKSKGRAKAEKRAQAEKLAEQVANANKWLEQFPSRTAEPTDRPRPNKTPYQPSRPKAPLELIGKNIKIGE